MADDVKETIEHELINDEKPDEASVSGESPEQKEAVAPHEPEPPQRTDVSPVPGEPQEQARVPLAKGEPEAPADKQDPHARKGS